MSHAFSLPFIAQVKIDCHVPERVHNCVCVCVYTHVHAPVCTGLAQNTGWMGCALCLCRSVFFWIVFLFLLLRFGGLPSSQTQLHPLLLVPFDPVSISPTNMMHPWHWADDFTLRDSSEQQMLRDFCRQPDVGFGWALQTSEDISNLKFYTLPFNHCLIHLLVIPTLWIFWYLLYSV